ncbi:cytochrome c oxidase polypeptide V [Xylariaceae sp. FL0804]|nr:cytochrome c oxidase polypeptide V [Xylariaceae sp. FL0804]
MMRTSATSALRAAARTSSLHSLVTRAALRSTIVPPAGVRTHVVQTTPISNPTLANIEKRWEVMPPPEQAELWMSLRDRMKGDWSELTLQEKRASWWIAFGPHGPRKRPEPGDGWRTFRDVMLLIGAACVLFVIMRMFANPAPSTMNREWQEATNEYLKKQRADPITGISSEGYKGKGAIQSPPKNG